MKEDKKYCDGQERIITSEKTLEHFHKKHRSYYSRLYHAGLAQNFNIK